MGQDGSGIHESGTQAGAFEMGEYDARFDQLKSSSFDPRTLWDRVNGDIELLRELVEIFLKEYPALLKGIAAAIERGSTDDVQKFSHKLKGSALQFSGLGASTLAASLERMGQENALQGASQILSKLEQEVETLVQLLQSFISEKGEPAN